MPAKSYVRLRGAPRPFLHKGSGQHAVKIRGRFYYLGKPDSDWQTEYRRLIDEVWSKPPAEAPVGIAAHRLDKLTIVELLEGFWRWADGYYVKNGKPSTQIAAITPPLRRLREQYGEQLAAEFGPLKLKALRQSWVDDGCARTTCNAYTSAVKLVFNWATENELVPASVGHAVAKVRHLAAGRDGTRESDPVTAVDDELVTATLPHLPSIVADMIMLQRRTGMRPGEVCMMRAADVKRYADVKPNKGPKSATLPLFPGESLPTRVKLDVWEYRPPGHKMAHKRKPRVVMIGPQAQAILDEYLARAGDGAVFPYTPAAYRRAIARACIRAFMPEHLRRIDRKLPAKEREQLQAEARTWREAHVWHPNQLRHTRATEIRSDYGLEAAQLVLGHTGSTRMTEQYAEPDLSKAAAIMRHSG